MDIMSVLTRFPGTDHGKSTGKLQKCLEPEPDDNFEITKDDEVLRTNDHQGVKWDLGSEKIVEEPTSPALSSSSSKNIDSNPTTPTKASMMKNVRHLVQHGKDAMSHGKEFVKEKKDLLQDKISTAASVASSAAVEQPRRLSSAVQNMLRHNIPGHGNMETLDDGTNMVENVRLLDRHNARNPTVGTLYLTATHLIFVDPTGKKETWILHMHISSVEKQALTTSGSPLYIQCKNFMSVTFVIPRDRDCHDIYCTLQKLSQPEALEDLYAFHFSSSDVPDRAAGWDFFDLQSEYLRLGVPNPNWTQSRINKDYEICDTYPSNLFIPSAATTPIVMGSARFRSRGRLPVLSYLHRDNQAAICRCSQPLSGFSARCVEDEQMLQAIRKANPAASFMYVVDTRPKINAMANRAAGKGYENENFYSNIKFQFWGIENIHVMRGSLQKMLEVCELKNPSMSAFLSGLESSGWMKHIKAVIDTSVFIAKAVQEGISVLVHCSDGWDRTAQTCGLASLLLDPYYRTIHGFQTLIEKEWLAFGHKYTDRCGLIGTVDAKEISPVFTQFIESVWQLTQQFPQAFQFNERYLITLHDHVYSCQFGTFIGNCQKDRIDLRLKERTYSLWGFLEKNREEYLNPFFKKELEVTMPTLHPVTNPQSIKFWKGLYCRFDSGIHSRESVYDTICCLNDHTGSVEDHGALLEKRIGSLCKLLGKKEQDVRQNLGMLSSSESMDFSAVLLHPSKWPQQPSPNAPNPPNNHHHQQHLTAQNGPQAANNQQQQQQQQQQRRESDSESGFEDGQSTLWKSTGSSVNESIEDLHIEQLLAELQSVALEWSSLRTSKTCSCAMPFEHYAKKNHCWRCGGVFCSRCIEKQVPLAGHMSQKPVPVCKACYKHVKTSPSANDLQQMQRSVEASKDT